MDLDKITNDCTNSSKKQCSSARKATKVIENFQKKKKNPLLLIDCFSQSIL